MALTDDARAELQKAIQIVREDKFEAFVRSRHTTPVETPKSVKDGPDAPPAKEKDDKTEPPTQTRKKGYWGELLDDDE